MRHDLFMSVNRWLGLFYSMAENVIILTIKVNTWAKIVELLSLTLLMYPHCMLYPAQAAYSEAGDVVWNVICVKVWQFILHTQSSKERVRIERVRCVLVALSAKLCWLIQRVSWLAATKALSPESRPHIRVRISVFKLSCKIYADRWNALLTNTTQYKG